MKTIRKYMIKSRKSALIDPNDIGTIEFFDDLMEASARLNYLIENDFVPEFIPYDVPVNEALLDDEKVEFEELIYEYVG